MDEIASPDLQIEATHILASLPNPVFLLDGADRFVFLNHAAEMFFDSSATMLTSSDLSQQIPADSSLMALLARARSQGRAHPAGGRQRLAPEPRRVRVRAR